MGGAAQVVHCEARQQEQGVGRGVYSGLLSDQSGGNNCGQTCRDKSEEFLVVSIPLDAVERVAHHLVIAEQGEVLTDLGLESSTLAVLQDDNSCVRLGDSQHHHGHHQSPHSTAVIALLRSLRWLRWPVLPPSTNTHPVSGDLQTGEWPAYGRSGLLSHTLAGTVQSSGKLFYISDFSFYH